MIKVRSNSIRRYFAIGALALVASGNVGHCRPEHLDFQGVGQKMNELIDLGGIGYSANLKDKIVVYKVKLSGGNAWLTGAPNSWAIFDVVDGKTVIIKQSTLLVSVWTGYAKWWDHTVIASRACKQSATGWDDPGSCVIGSGSIIKLPEGTSVFDYFFEFKWEENGGIQLGKSAIDPKAQPESVRLISK